MASEKLRQQLETLQKELSQVQVDDPERQAQLNKLSQDISGALEREDLQQEHVDGLSERLQDSVAWFEATHPSLTLAIRQAIDELAYLGV